MEFLVKKTSECTQRELIEMNNLFNEVFERERPLEIMLNLYTKNPLGYAYHSLFIEDGHIVGMNVYVPYYYRLEGEKVLFANSIDSMIQKNHRDFFNFMDMVNTAYDFMKNEGVVMVYGYPNDNAYPVVIKSKLMKEVGKMYTYCLPYRIGSLKKGFGLMNWASKLFCWAWVSLSSLFASSKIMNFKIEKDIDSFNKTRYQLSDGKYEIQEGFVYKIIDFEGLRAAFLIDVFEKSSTNFCKAIRHILKYDSSKFDILLYPGYLNFFNTGMIKIPHKYEPKRFVLCGKLLDESFESKKLWNIKCWDTNLSNYDLI